MLFWEGARSDRKYIGEAADDAIVTYYEELIFLFTHSLDHTCSPFLPHSTAIQLNGETYTVVGVMPFSTSFYSLLYSRLARDQDRPSRDTAK